MDNISRSPGTGSSTGLLNLRSAIVANASDDVKAGAIEETEINNREDTLYIASGDCCGMNGNYSAGIVEGILHYMPQMKILIARDEENHE